MGEWQLNSKHLVLSLLKIHVYHHFSHSTDNKKIYSFISDILAIKWQKGTWGEKGIEMHTSLDVCSCNTVPSSCAYKWFSVQSRDGGGPEHTEHIAAILLWQWVLDLIELFAWCYRCSDAVCGGSLGSYVVSWLISRSTLMSCNLCTKSVSSWKMCM